MLGSSNVETREILLPSLDIVYGHSGAGARTPRDDHCVSVRDSAGMAVINNINIGIAVIYLIRTSMHFNTYRVSYLSWKPGSWVPSGLIRVVVLSL